MNHISAGKYLGLKKMSDANGHLRLFNIDQNALLSAQVLKALQLDELPDQGLRNLKDQILRVITPECSGVIVDPVYSLANALTVLDNGIGFGISLDIEDRSSGKIVNDMITNWGVNKIARVGGNSAKMSLSYIGDQGSVATQNQRDLVKTLGEQCQNYDIAFLLHLSLQSAEAGRDTNNVDNSEKNMEIFLRALDVFRHTEYAVDLFIIEIPYPVSELPDPKSGHHRRVQKVQEAFNNINQALEHAWVVYNGDLKADRSKSTLLLEYALKAGASGYALAEALWWEDFQHFPNISRFEDSMVANSVSLLRDMNRMCRQSAQSWRRRSRYTSSGDEATPYNTESRYFPSLYPMSRPEL